MRGQGKLTSSELKAKKYMNLMRPALSINKDLLNDDFFLNGMDQPASWIPDERVVLRTKKEFASQKKFKSLQMKYDPTNRNQSRMIINQNVDYFQERKFNQPTTLLLTKRDAR